jgi:hypothetical protein
MALADLKKAMQEYNKQAADNTSQEAQHELLPDLWTDFRRV